MTNEIDIFNKYYGAGYTLYKTKRNRWFIESRAHKILFEVYFHPTTLSLSMANFSPIEEYYELWKKYFG